jgi:hypothetical protein
MTRHPALWPMIAGAGRPNGRNDHAKNLVGFNHQRGKSFLGDDLGFDEHFHPENRFIGLLFNDTQLCLKFGGTATSASRSIVCGYRSSAAQ